MSLDAGKLVFVHQMEKASLKLSNFSGRRGHTHGFLTTSQQNMILGLTNHSIIHGTIRLVRFQVLQIHSIKQFGREIRRTGDKERLFLVHAHAVDFLFVRLNFVLQISRFRIVQANLPIVKRHQQVLIERRPVQIGRIDALAANLGQVNFQHGRIRPLRGIVIVVSGNFVDANFGIVFHKWIANGGKLDGRLRRPFRPRHAADGTAVRKLLQALARFNLPQPTGGVRRRCEQFGGEAVAVQIPNGPLVAGKGAQSLAVFAAPDRGNEIFARAKEQVAVVIVLNRRNGTFVSL